MALMERRRGEPTLKPVETPTPRMPMPARPPSMPPAATLAPVYDEEVLRVAQRDYDNRRMISALESDRDEWRRKALAAQDECRRLEARLTAEALSQEEALAKLTDQRDRRVEELTRRRDEYGHKLARLDTKTNIQGKQLMDLVKRTAKTIDELADGASKVIHEMADAVSKNVVETMEELKGEYGTPDVAGAAGLAAIADAIEQEQPMPKVVTAGPASNHAGN